ncbi:MAG TPA: hypothetical protein VN758_02675 [Solirubrobacterales bacterium]|nr:hypothetical protein [Solirubrobacterales bacterium]
MFVLPATAQGQPSQDPVGGARISAAAPSYRGLNTGHAVLYWKLRSSADPDKDGLRNSTELHRTKTNPRKFDTDGDGAGDGAELLAGSDPRDQASVPGVVGVLRAVAILITTSVSRSDTAAPDTMILSGPAATTTSTNASFSFSSGKSGSRFECKLDSGSWDTCSSPKTYNALNVGSHSFSVRATDAAGNVDASPASRSWVVRALGDTTPPNTSIVSGPLGATTSTTANFNFSSNESGSSFQCKLDSGVWDACGASESFASLALGGHTVSVRAVDSAGNIDLTPATRGWTVQASGDMTAPDTTIDSGPSATTTSTSASFGFSSSEANSSFQCSLDSGPWGDCASPTSYSSLAAGSHTFSARATDASGNTDVSPASRTWTVEAAPDTTPPQTSIASGPSGTTFSLAASFGFYSSEGGSSFQCQLDAGPWSTCATPQAYASLGLGPHTFAVKATDAAGNTDASPAGRAWTVESGSCTQTLSPGTNLSSAISAAPAGTVICLDGGSWSFNLSSVSKSDYVTVQSNGDQLASLGYSILNNSSFLRFRDLKFTGGAEMIGASNHIEFLDSEFTGPFGIRANGDEASRGTNVTDVLIDGNYLHDLDYTGSQGPADGYGITAVNGVERFTIADNTIKSVAADYLQSASPIDFIVTRNTLLGPSLVGAHPQEHQDLWQIFGGGTNITYSNNVARNTGTHESLLFQEGAFSNVVIENNLFDHDSRGYTCQLYQSSGMVFRNNTVVGSHWGCLFRDLASSVAGSGYQVDHNVFANTEASVDVSTEGRAGSWGTYDYNVSSDGSASGSHSVRNWSPSWSDTNSYTPFGLPFEAGFRP